MPVKPLPLRPWALSSLAAICVFGLLRGLPLQAMRPGAQAGAHHAAAHPNRHLLDLLHTINPGEIQAGRWMSRHAKNTRVKRFAAMLERDHARADHKVKALAAFQHLPLHVIARLQHQQRLELQQLKKAGSRADRLYVRAEVRDHRKAIAKVRAMRKQATKSRVRALAGMMIPQLEKHLHAAQALEKK